jgi:hypothetical protein
MAGRRFCGVPDATGLPRLITVVGLRRNAMSADQIAEIRPAMREAIEGAPDTCITFEVAGVPSKWMQVVDRTINAAYPHDDHPQNKLTAMPALPGLKVAGWEARKFATFELPGLDVTILPGWIDAYFINVLACTAGEYHLDITTEKF